MRAELDNEQQTHLTVTTPIRTESPPPLPTLDDPVICIEHPDVMPVSTRRNYIKNRMREAVIYITEYGQTQTMLQEIPVSFWILQLPSRL